MNADDAWTDLNAALKDVTPPCAGHASFTADFLADEQRAECASICAGCPIADPCAAYASVAKVESGFWAGRSYSPKRWSPRE